jgi:hypothetical protein
MTEKTFGPGHVSDLATGKPTTKKPEVSPSWQDVATRWLKAYEDTSVELAKLKAEMKENWVPIALSAKERQDVVAERDALRAELERVKEEKAAALTAEQSLRTTVNRLEVELERARDEHQKALASVRARAEEAEKRAEEAEKVPPSSSWWLEWKGRAESAEALVETLAGALYEIRGYPSVADWAQRIARAALSGKAGT